MFSILASDLVRWCSPAGRYQETSWNTVTVVKRLLTEQGTWAVVEYRFRRWVRRTPAPLRVPLSILTLFSKKLIELTTGISISSAAEFGRGLYIGHFSGIVVGDGVRVGENRVGGGSGTPVSSGLPTPMMPTRRVMCSPRFGWPSIPQ